MRNRRDFIKSLAAATGATVLLPSVTSCKKDKEDKAAATDKPTAEPAKTEPPAKPENPETPAEVKDKPAVMAEPPTAKPADWQPVAFNKERGKAGAIPETYWPSIDGPDGDAKHLGKHLPYQPKVDAKMVPDGFVALMWGDPEKGHAKHPNAAKGPANNNEGHWYNWIKIRKAGEGEEEELKSSYSDWPAIGEGDNGKYVAFGGDDIKADGGKNTVYMAALPKGLKSGDTIRIWAHCLTHGEYVDFITLA